MPQQRREVKLILISGEERTAIATGNNASWHCVCAAMPLLIGRSEESKNMAVGNRIDCPSCARRYYVISVGPKLGAVQEVTEVPRDPQDTAPNPAANELNNYGTTSGLLKPLDQVQLPDQRFAFMVLHNLDRERPFELADLHERLSSWPFSKGVPENVKVQFETAKNLMLYAWFVFEFQTVAELQAFGALELALRQRLGSPTKSHPKKTSSAKPLMLFDLLAKAVDEGLIVPEKLPSWER